MAVLHRWTLASCCRSAHLEVGVWPWRFLEKDLGEEEPGHSPAQCRSACLGSVTQLRPGEEPREAREAAQEGGSREEAAWVARKGLAGQVWRWSDTPHMITKAVRGSQGEAEAVSTIQVKGCK